MKTPPRSYHLMQDDDSVPHIDEFVHEEMEKMAQDWANVHDRQMNADEAEEAEEDARIKAMEKELKRLKKEKKRKQMPKKEEKLKPKAKKMQKSKSMKTRPLLMAPASPLPRTPPPPSPPPSLPVPVAPPPTPIPPPLDTLPEEDASLPIPPPSQKPAPSLPWADREYVPSDADGEEEEDQPVEAEGADDDVLFVGVRPATMTTLGALLGTMKPIEDRAKEMVAMEQRDAQKMLIEVTMNEVEEAMYGEAVARKMGKVIAAYEVRGRGRGQAMPLIQRIIKLCDVCDMAKLLQAKCEAFCPFMYAPFVFGRLVRSAVLFNRRNDYPLDAQQLFFFLFHCF
jgi:hypothetical protein